MEKTQLNKNDIKLLNLCEERGRSINELAKLMDIAAKNVSVRIKKLQDAGLIVASKSGKGRKTTIITKKKLGRMHDEVINALKDLQEKKEVSFDNFNQSIIPIKEKDSEEKIYNKMHAKSYVMFSDLTERIIRISEKGKQFLQENKK